MSSRGPRSFSDQQTMILERVGAELESAEPVGNSSKQPQMGPVLKVIKTNIRSIYQCHPSAEMPSVRVSVGVRPFGIEDRVFARVPRLH